MTADAHPRTYATVTGPHATFVTLDGASETISTGPDEDIRHVVIKRAATEAKRAGAPLELVTSGDRGNHHLLVGVDGQISAVEVASEPSVSQPDKEVPPTRRSFIAPAESDAPTTGRRAMWSLRTWMHVRENAYEQHQRTCESLVSQHWAGHRNIAVANGKGGVGKTMSSAMLAAVFGRFGGGNVLAWDNNDTRGTLGWRTEQGLYDTTVRDLLPASAELLSVTAAISDIARFVHHQSADHYDVLRSNPELLATDQRITADEFDRLMRVAAHYYRLIVFDSGNDESAERWLRMIDGAHQLVVPTLPSAESAESAALLLEALRERDDHCASLAANAVIVVTQPEPGDRGASSEIAAGFADQVRAVETIPFDRALKSGALRFDALNRRTRDAWIRVSAAAAIGLE